ncbi:MAG: hypothetical protein U5K84_00980 [Alkalibacterium sp.]|nr:hypothetical protein [Alkalibacterium sp.]
MTIHFEQSLPSTNTAALSSLDQSDSNTLVLTDHQTEGKGRLGRRWQDVSGKSVAFSLILKPALDYSKIPLFTQLAAASLYQTLWTYGDVKIKWPNNSHIKRKKSGRHPDRVTVQRFTIIRDRDRYRDKFK